MLLWRFCVGYSDESGLHSSTPIPLLFIVLPIAFHADTVEFVQSTQRRSGLRAFVGKFGDSRTSMNDLILAINHRASKMRGLSLNSLQIAIATKILAIDKEHGMAIPTSVTPPRAGIPESIKPLIKSVEKLGNWCSHLSLHEIANNLKVSF